MALLLFLFTLNTRSMRKVCTGISSQPSPTWTFVRSRRKGRGLLASHCEWTGAWCPGWTGRPDSARTAHMCAPCSRGFRPSTDPATPTTVPMRHGSKAGTVGLNPLGPRPPVTPPTLLPYCATPERPASRRSILASQLMQTGMGFSRDL